MKNDIRRSNKQLLVEAIYKYVAEVKMADINWESPELQKQIRQAEDASRFLLGKD